MAPPSLHAAKATVLQMLHPVARRSERRIHASLYDRWHAVEAREAEERIGSARPDHRLDAATGRRIEAYARDVLGSPRFAPWLRVYAVWAGEFREGWIPDNYFGRVVNSPNAIEPARLCRFKTMSRRVFASELFPDVAYHMGGAWLDLAGRALRPADVDDHVFASHERVVAKFDASSRGRGVHVLRRGRDSLRDLEGRGDFVVQSFIEQADELSRFAPESVATIRLTTVRTPERPAEVRAHYLRLGRTGDASVASARHVRVPIPDRSGRLARWGALADWTPVTAHPDTGLPFEDGAIPGFEAACASVERLHDTLPQVEVIGWDVAITEDHAHLVMEWNAGHPDIKFTEATIGPCFDGLGWEERWRD